MSIYVSGGLEVYFTDWNRLSFCFQFCSGTRLTGVDVCTASKRYKKRELFHYKNVKESTPNLTYMYVHGLCTIFFLMKQIFEEKKNHQGQRPEVRISFSLK